MALLRAKAAAKTADQQAQIAEQLAALAAPYMDATITLRDARATGACDEGIRRYCARHTLPYVEGRCTIREALAAYRHGPEPALYAAICLALRRAAKRHVARNLPHAA